MYRYGYHNGLSALDEDGFSFGDSDANNYYNALVTANGGDIDSQTLYSISLDTFKTAINTLFISLKADGTYSELVHFYPIAGGTANTHSVCAIDAAEELTYVGSPTHGADGITLNGTTQYIDSGNTPENDVGSHDNHLMQLFDTVDTNYGFGSRNASNEAFLFIMVGTNKIMDNTSSGVRLTVADSVLDKVNIITRVSNVDGQIYVDGSSIGTVTTAASDDPPSASTWFGAWNNNGSPSAYGAGDVRSASIGTGLSSSQASTLTNAVTAFNTSLGR